MRFGPLLRLLRLPAVFTTFPDVLAGFALVFAAAELSQLTWLLLSSACLYLSGMVLNDCFDVEDDRRERANRPIPQGEISLATGWKLACLLMVAGIGFAGLGGTVSLAVSIVLNALFLRGAWAIWRRDEVQAEADSYRTEKKVFGLSLLYLFGHFGAILVESTLRVYGLGGW